MGITTLGQILQLPNAARLNAKLQSGDVVFVNVIKEISEGKWAIGIRGSVFHARSTLGLNPGDILTARVIREGDTVLLRLEHTPPLLMRALQKEGLDHDPLALVIVANLIKSNVKIEAHTIGAVRRLLEKLKGDIGRNARVASLLAAKGISLEAGDIEGLVALIDYEAGREGGRHKDDSGKRQAFQPDREEITAAVKKAVKNTASPGTLALFNHLRSVSGQENWIVIPFDIDLGGVGLSGTLRFLMEASTKRIKKTVVVAAVGKGERFHFMLKPDGTSYAMSVYCNRKRLIGASLKRFDDELRKLGNMGVKCDDIILDETQCDGFDDERERLAYQSIDTKG